MAHTKVEFSDIESEVLGLRISRCNSDHFDEKELMTQVIAGGYDLCRLKIPAEDELASIRLEKTGLPFYFSGSIRRYKTRITANVPGDYTHKGLVFEQYDGSQDQLLKDMLIGTWGSYPIGYYRTPYLHRLITKEMEIESVFRFYKKFNLQRDFPNNTIMFIRDGEVYTGFFALNIVGQHLESHIGGILKPYQADGYFSDMLRYIRDYCLQHQLTHFVFGARNENAVVQQIFQKEGFAAQGSENVFHIPSLLSCGQKNAISVELNIGDITPAELYRLLLEETMNMQAGKQMAGSQVSFKLIDFGERLIGETYRLTCSVPVEEEGELLGVVKLLDSRGKLLKLGYLGVK